MDYWALRVTTACAQVARHSQAVSVGQSCMCWTWCSPALLYIGCTLHGERCKAPYYGAKDGESLVQMWCVRISLSRSDTDGPGCAQSIRGHELQSATPDVSGEPRKSRSNICSKFSRLYASLCRRFLRLVGNVPQFMHYQWIAEAKGRRQSDARRH